LTGLELRGCWRAAAAAAEPEPPRRLGVIVEPGVRLRDFVPVEAAKSVDAPVVPAPIIGLEAGLPWADRATLFGDVEG
jgi:hypothetical protein